MINLKWNPWFVLMMIVRHVRFPCNWHSCWILHTYIDAMSRKLLCRRNFIVNIYFRECMHNAPIMKFISSVQLHSKHIVNIWRQNCISRMENVDLLLDSRTNYEIGSVRRTFLVGWWTWIMKILQNTVRPHRLFERMRFVLYYCISLNCLH